MEEIDEKKKIIWRQHKKTYVTETVNQLEAPKRAMKKRIDQMNAAP